MISKFFWFIRAIIYNLFTSFKLPGYIGKPLFINSLRKIKFEKKVRIYPGLRAEVFGRNGKIKIGKNVSIGQNFHIVAYDDILEIGDNVVISGNVFVSNCDHSYQEKDKYLYNQPIIKKHTQIGNNCFIGYGAVIQAGTVLGKQCIVGSNSVVRGEFPDYCVIVGSPAKIIKKYNEDTKKWENMYE